LIYFPLNGETMDSVDKLREDLKEFKVQVANKLGKTQLDRLDRMIERLDPISNAIKSDAVKSDKKACIEALSQYMGWHTGILRNDWINVLRSMGFSIEDLALMFQTSHQNMRSRIQTADATEADKVPAWMQAILAKDQKDITDDDMERVLKWKMFSMATTDKATRDTNEAASKLLANLQSRKKEDWIVSYEQNVVIREFLMSELLPALHRRFQIEQVAVDIKKIFYDALLSLDDKVKAIGQRIWALSEMDELIAKAKKRGKWKKKDVEETEK